MANEEHLKILKQGVEIWNRWREEHPDIKPDLDGADLRRSDLRTANLSETHLSGADLWRADLQEADLSGVDFQEVDLHHAISLEHAKLHDACGMPEWISQGIDDSGRYTQARLSEAITQGFKNLNKANLYKIYLREVDLSGADLSGADLSGAHLERTVLRDADLSGADMERTDLGKADLRRACLRGAHLRKTFLVEADLREANLCGARLERADLIQTNMSHANITGANLYGSARDDWIISGIQCDYVYWDLKPHFKNKGQEQQWKQEHRVPKDRDFRPGEFEELYKHLPTFEYYFEHGFTPIDAVVMDQVVQGINERHPEFSLRLKNFEATGTPHATLTVLHKDHIESAKTQVTTDYEARLAALEGKQEQLMQIVSTLVNQPQYIGELIMGDKRMILAGHNYHERINGNVQITTGTSNSEESSAEQKPGIPGRSIES